MSDLRFRKAQFEDVSHIVSMLADDELGAKRENNTHPLPDAYIQAFHKIDADSNQELIVAVEEEEIIGTMQLTFIPYLTYQGGIRSQIEAVRIKKDKRGSGVGQQMFQWAIKRAQERGAHVLQLTTDKQRPDALHFYEKLGFKSSHEGMKMHF